MRFHKAVSYYPHIILCCFFILINSGNVLGSDSAKVNKSIWQDIKSDLKISFDEGISYYSSPAGFTTRDWIYTAAGAGITLGIMTLDKEIKSKASVQNGDSQQGFWAAARVYGDAKYPAAASLLIYSTGLFAREKEIRITGRMLLQSMLYSGLVTTFVKFVIGRSRPYSSDNQFKFNWFETDNDKLSFPSGHATVAFAVSSVLAERINTWWSRAVFYSFAALTAYSRVHDNQHWFSDSVIGSLVGFSSGYFVVHHTKNNSTRHTSTLQRINVFPSINGMSLVYSF